MLLICCSLEQFILGEKFSHISISIFFFSYEPELHPGVTYRIKDLKATLKIFSTGSITVTGTAKILQHKRNHVNTFSAPRVAMIWKKLWNFGTEHEKVMEFGN